MRFGAADCRFGQLFGQLKIALLTSLFQQGGFVVFCGFM
jgi:hypothetical protein